MQRLLFILAFLVLLGCSKNTTTSESLSAKGRQPGAKALQPVLNVEEAQNALATLLFDTPNAFEGDPNRPSGLEMMKAKAVRSGNLSVVDLCGIEVDLDQKVYLKRGFSGNWKGQFVYEDGNWHATPPQKITR